MQENLGSPPFTRWMSVRRLILNSSASPLKSIFALFHASLKRSFPQTLELPQIAISSLNQPSKMIQVKHTGLSSYRINFHYNTFTCVIQQLGLT